MTIRIFSRFFEIASLALFGVLCGTLTIPAMAMPTWYLLSPTGNERDVDWMRLESSRFSLYFDKNAEPFARHALSSVEYAYPYLSQILGVTLPHQNLPNQKSSTGKSDDKKIVSRFDYIPLVLSTRGDYGGFANFGTQNIELQVASGSGASLFQHELVHRLMYEHFDPLVGPAGRAFSLAMLPTWWIEGLAEYLTESVGRIETAGVARTLALKNSYLSWDRMHALYGQGDYFLRGYVTSGRLVKYTVEKTKTTDLNELHKLWFWKTVTPPFVNAPDRFYDQMFDKSGREMFEDFKAAEKKYWTERFEGMPKIPESMNYSRGISVGYPAQVVFTKNHVVLSSMQNKPYFGGPYIGDLNASPGMIMHRLGIEGSSRFDLLPYKEHDDGFWTARFERLPNAALGSQLVYTTYNGRFENIQKQNIVSSKTLLLATPEKPFQVEAIYARPQQTAYILATLRGQQYLLEADAKTNSVKELHHWPAPLSVRFVKVASALREKETEQSCIDFVVNADLEKTYLQRYCPAEKGLQSIETGTQLFIKDVVRLADSSLIALVGWNEALGLARIREQKTEFLGPMLEYGDNLHPTFEDNTIAMWIYDGEYYRLRRINLEAYKQNSQAWRNGLPSQSIWKADPQYIPYQPPFARNNEATSSLATEASEHSQAVVKIAPEEATYRSKHFYTYPTFLAPPLAPWTFGIMSIPFQDEMERYRLLVNLNYNSETKAYSGSVAYQSNRLFDGLTVSTYSQERYNGQYYVSPCRINGEKKNCVRLKYDPDAATTGVNYLREQGVEIETTHLFLPTSLGLNLHVSGSKIEPSSDTYFGTRPPAFLGTTRTYLFNAGGTLFFTLFQVAGVVNENAKQNTTDTYNIGRYILWTTSGAVAGDTYRSAIEAKDGFNNEANPLQYHRVNGTLQSAVSYDEKTLTLRSYLSGTLGERAFNLRELYQPYRTYLPGSGASLNAVNMLITGDADIFRRATGFWSYRNSADISLPIFSDLDQKFYIAYFEALRGELVIARGGVARDKDFKNLYQVTSASAGMRIDIDVKGVKIFPSFSFGKIIGQPGWSLFGELAFSQIL